MTLKITLRELEVLVAIADEGSVTLAANKLSMTQSAASQALATLETQLAVQLFDRIGRKLMLNEHGRLLLPNARMMLDTARVSEQLFSESAQLRFGMTLLIADYIFPQNFSNFLVNNTAIETIVRVQDAVLIYEAVANFELDIGFVEGASHHPDLQITPWIEDTMGIFASRYHPLAQKKVSIEELANFPWILPTAGTGAREEIESILLPALGTLNIKAEVGSPKINRQLVASNYGVACLSHFVAKDLAERGEIIELKTPLPKLTRTLFRVIHNKKQITSTMHSFLDELSLRKK